MVTAHRTRLGLYMYTPMLGGAELNFKDLVWNIDRARYDVTVFYEAWPDFDEFLDLAHCPEVCSVPAPVIEPTGHYTMSRTSGEQVAVNPGRASGFIRPLRGLKRRLPTSLGRVAGRTVGLAARYPVMPLNGSRLRRMLRQHPVDILHINNGGYPGAQSAQMAAIAAHEMGYRTLMTIANTPLPHQWPHWLEQMVDRRVSMALDKVVMLAEGQARLMIEQRGFRPDQMAVIPYGFRDLGGPLASQAARPTITVGLVGSFLKLKGHHYLIEAVIALRARYPQLRVLFIGDGPTRRDIELLCQQRGVDDLVTFKGYCPQAETLELMRQIDILTVPSELEGMPYVILQAMSLGLPVVATRVGGIPDMIVPGETGDLVPPMDVPALTHALDRMLESPAAMRRIGRQGYARFQAQFSIDRMLQNYQTLYDTLLRQGA
jgi:glycosyltransferase involved in cell wall biosynthesis